MFDVEPAFLDIDIGRAVFAHRPEFDDVAVRGMLLDRPDDIEGRAEIIVEGARRFFVSQHRIGRRGLFGIMDDGLGLKLLDEAGKPGKIRAIADLDANRRIGDRAPDFGALGQVRIRHQGFGVEIARRISAEIIIEDRDVVALMGKRHGGRPAEIAVPA